MASGVSMLRKFGRLLSPTGKCNVFKQPVRHGWSRLVGRGKRPEEARNLSERLLELEAKDPELDKEINIGFPKQKTTLGRKEFREWQQTRKEKEQMARLGTLTTDLKKIKTEYELDRGLTDTRILAEHYGIYHDLFNDAFFEPTTPLQVFYDYDEEFVIPVYRGNRVQPNQTTSAPTVQFESDPASLWSLILTNLDGHLQDNTSEVLHWFIANIRGGEVEKGETICDYLPPFPLKGSGFHRLVFVLYKQDKKLDFAAEKRSHNSPSLEERTFRTLDFYREYQDEITAAGLAFYQTEWDDSVTDIFHKVLDMPEPSFEFVHPPIYHPEQVKFPIKKPFDLYLDRYRDVKDIQEEVLREKLKNVQLFSRPPPPPKFPNIGVLPQSYPRWIKSKIEKQRLKKNQWAEL